MHVAGGLHILYIHIHAHPTTHTPPGDDAHLFLDVSDSLIVQLRCGAHLEDEPRSYIVINIKYDGQRQQEQTNEDPALMHDHVVQAFDFDPDQEQDEQPGHVQQRIHG